MVATIVIGIVLATVVTIGIRCLAAQSREDQRWDDAYAASVRESNYRSAWNAKR